MDSRLTGLNLKTSLAALSDLVLPRICVVCSRELLLQEKHICLNCLADLPQTHFFNSKRNPMADKFNSKIIVEQYEPYSYATALFHYSPSADYSRISMALKYYRNFGVGKYFAHLLSEKLRKAPQYCDVDLIVPVPLHWTRKWSRGYNQAEIIAKEVAKSLSVALCSELLVRIKRTKTQTLLSGDSKTQNLEGAFKISKKCRQELHLKDSKFAKLKHILLIDDIFTSGATINECRKALREHFPPPVLISAATLGFAGE